MGRMFYANPFTITMTIITPRVKVSSALMTILPVAKSVSISTHSRNLTQQLIKASNLAYCLDVLRQQLMCTVDTGVVGQVWMYPENPEPYADMNTRHKCKNFDDIRQWAEDNQLPENPPDDFLQQPRPGDLIYKRMP